MASDFNIFYGTMSTSVSFPWFGLTPVKEQRNFDFESH